jgi:hypothetical protein
MVTEKPSNAMLWSDGFIMAPGLQDVISFTKCPACNTFFGISENLVQEPSATDTVKRLENHLSGTDIPKEIRFFKEAIKSGVFKTPEQEIQVRTKLWHTINHIIRKYTSESLLKKIEHKMFKSNDYETAKEHYNALSSLKLNNLIRLANLMKSEIGENINNIMLAEIYRESGNFDRARIYCYKAEASSSIDLGRINLLKQHIQNKDKMVYKT